jgi:hypothetical protein
MSRTDVPCFPGGSGPGFCGDVAAFGVLANCLSGRKDESLAFGLFKKCAALFKKSFQGMWTLYVTDIP